MTGAFHPCENLHCRRKVRTVVKFCCRPCADAAEGHYENDAHDSGCDERRAARGVYTAAELTG